MFYLPFVYDLRGWFMYKKVSFCKTVFPLLIMLDIPKTLHYHKIIMILLIMIVDIISPTEKKWHYENTNEYSPQKKMKNCKLSTYIRNII